MSPRKGGAPDYVALRRSEQPSNNATDPGYFPAEEEHRRGTQANEDSPNERCYRGEILYMFSSGSY